MAPSRLIALAKEVEINATKLDKYLAENNLPEPSFDEHGPLRFPPEIAATQEALSNALDELWWLNQGPIPTIVAKAIPTSVGLKFVLKYGIQNLVPFESGTTFEELASKIGIPVNKVTRILRLAMADHFFREPEQGSVKHTIATKALAQIPRLAAWSEMAIYEIGPAKSRLVDAVAKWPESEEPQHTGFSLANDTDKSMFEFFEEHPERLSRFKDSMIFLQDMPVLGNSILLNSFDWASLGEGTVVDVGGSHGQDLPKVIEDAKSQAPSTAMDRVSFMAHDFFQEQPVKNADVFYFRLIFHNWSNKYCIKILRALIPALKSGAKILFSDKCHERPRTATMRQERSNRDIDIMMMAICNSQERDEDEWAELFQAADPRFKLEEIKKVKGAMLSLVIARWE